MTLMFAPRSGKIALIRYKREWRVCFVETPDRHLTFANVYFYGGKTLAEAIPDAERVADKNGFEFVGRLDKYLKQQAATHDGEDAQATEGAGS